MSTTNSIFYLLIAYIFVDFSSYTVQSLKGWDYTELADSVRTSRTGLAKSAKPNIPRTEYNMLPRLDGENNINTKH